MNVLSLFDGMSCGRIALERAGVKVDKYYASEIDPYSIKVSKANWGDINHVGDILKWPFWNIDFSEIDLVIGGSPCQGFSSAGKQGGTIATVNGVDEVVNTLQRYKEILNEIAFEGVEVKFKSQSYLFWEFILVLEYVKNINPNVKFMLENVKMSKHNMEMISSTLGVEPVFINSSLLSAQNRQRYYWADWDIPQPEDKGILLKDVLEHDGVGFIKNRGEYLERNIKAMCVDANYHKGIDNHGQRTMINPAAMVGRKLNEKGIRDDTSDVKAIQCLEVHEHGKARCLSTVSKDTLVSSLPVGRYPISSKEHYRKLTPIECERLQTVPDNYTDHVSNTQRYKMLGNGWTVDVIAHIFKAMNL